MPYQKQVNFIVTQDGNELADRIGMDHRTVIMI